MGLKSSIQPLEKLVMTAGYPKGFCNCDFLLNLWGKPVWNILEKSTEGAAPSSLLLNLGALSFGSGQEKCLRGLAFVSLFISAGKSLFPTRVNSPVPSPSHAASSLGL